MKIIKRKSKVNINPKLEEAKKLFFKSYNPNEHINIQATARSFGVSRVTIYNWIKQINE